MKIFWVYEWEFFGFGCQENTWKKEKKRKIKKREENKDKFAKNMSQSFGEEHKEHDDVLPKMKNT